MTDGLLKGPSFLSATEGKYYLSDKISSHIMMLLNPSVRPPRMEISNDIAIVYPRGSAKICASIVIVGRDPCVIIDAGSYNDPGPSLLIQALKKFGTSPDKVTAILITHFHIDHVGGLSAIAQKLPNARIYCHDVEAFDVLHHFRVMKHWNHMFRYNNFSPLVFAGYDVLLTAIDLLQRMHSLSAKKIVGIKDATFHVQAGTGMIHPIISPGHSSGHFCFLHENGDLFLGDMIPRTPWIDLDPGALLSHIESVKRLINLPPDKIRRAIRSHASIRDKGRSIYPWEEERDKFRQHLELINETLERVPRFLKNRELTVPQLLPVVMRGVRPYSKLLSNLVVDPNTTWVAAFLEELETQGKVHRSHRQGRIWWSA